MTWPARTTRQQPRLGGLRLLLTATAIGGVAGYLVTWLVPREIGFARYTAFAVFWAFLFLLVSALSGVQQEVARATSRGQQQGFQRRVTAVAATMATGVFVLIVATAPSWVEAAFPEHEWGLVWPLAIGAASYVAAAVVYGALYGIRQWRILFMLITVEALVRLVAIGVVLAMHPTIVALVWAVALPIPAALLALCMHVRRALTHGARLDVHSGDLAWNIARTVVAAASMGVMISGFPLLLGLTSAAEPRATVGLMMSVVTLVRAPIIIVAMAFQSYLVVLFRSYGRRWGGPLVRLAIVLLAAAGVLSMIVYLWGPQAFRLLFPSEIVPQASLLAALVASSALVGLLCLTAPAVLARSQHTLYSAGWLLAALATAVCLNLSLPFNDRTLIALFAGPFAGLIIHAIALAMPHREDSTIAHGTGGTP